MNEDLTELVSVEEKLPFFTFSQEKSSLGKINSNFSPFEEKDFLDWLNYLFETKERVEILEVGGGVNLVAAAELLDRFGNFYLTEIEKREINDRVRENFPRDRFNLYQNGFSEAVTQLGEKKFDVIFLHNVLPHLPNPFFILEKCFGLLAENGLLFVNGILIYKEEWEKIIDYLQKEGYQFSFYEEEAPSELRKKGIISVSLTIKKDNQHENLTLPIKLGDFLTDFSGARIGVKEVFCQR